MHIPRSAPLIAASAFLSLAVFLPSRQAVSQVAGDRPVIRKHVDQSYIDSGLLQLPGLVESGRFLFMAKFNRLDGYGRPASTGSDVPTKRDPEFAPMMSRLSGLDANSCFGCHNDPEAGGGADFAANAFVMSELADPVITSIDAEFSNERNSPGLHGAGPIEALAVEMSRDLIAIRESARQQAAQANQSVTLSLDTKGVNFGSITAHSDGSVDTSGVEGVDHDLVIKPFHQKGVANSIRVFVVNAMNRHFGMQAAERFGQHMTGEADYDEDGVLDELSVGDVTATALFIAALPVPTQVGLGNRRTRSMVQRGEAKFMEVGCGDCHRPALILDDPNFYEPNPFNAPGTLRPQDVPQQFAFDMTQAGLGNRLERLPDGRAVVRAFTDLKRHVIADNEDPFFANERVVQGGVPLETFITRKLWDAGSSAPYGHRGDCTTLGEAIFHHAGEARASRNAFMALPAGDQSAIIEFLNSLQVVGGN